VTLRGIGRFLLASVLVALVYEAFAIVLGDEGFSVRHLVGSVLLVATLFGVAWIEADEVVKPLLLRFVVMAGVLSVMLGVVVASVYSGHPSEIALWSSPFAAGLILLFDARRERSGDRVPRSTL
jgi:hypothetical protein